MENYNTGYSTYVIGNSGSVSNSLEAILYNKNDNWDPKLPKISLYNIEEVYSGILSSTTGEYVRINRKTSSDPFKYEDNLTNGFSVIIYMSIIDSTPIGYTEFLNPQGRDSNINIYISLNSSITNQISISLSNSLDQLKNNSTTGKDFLDDINLYNYTGVSTIKKDLETIDVYPRYTSHVYHVLENKQMNLLLDYGAGNSGGLYKIDLNHSVVIDPYSHNYENHQIGFYGEDIVLYSWTGNKYSIKSLVQKTRFGNPIVYTTSEGSDYSIFKDLRSDQSIFFFSGRFIVTIGNNYPSIIELYDIERQQWITTDYQNFYVDPLDPRNRIVSIPSNVSNKNIVNYIPEINSTFLNLTEYVKYTNINIIKKYGDWYVFKDKQSSKKDFHIYSCVDKLIYTVRTGENPIMINNSLFMIHTVDEELGLDYYTIYHDPGISYYTERARAASNNIQLEFDEDLGILVSKDSELEKYRQFYKEGKILIVHRNNPTGIFGTILTGFRRSYFKPSLRKEVPKIITSFYGLLYYIDEDGYLNYL
nr:MAG TPA: hypothetical protein [Bacteriophage sp.]